MNTKHEKEHLELLDKMLSDHKSVLKKYRLMSLTLIIVGFGIAFGIPVYSSANPDVEVNTSFYILSGLLIGGGWFQNMSLRGWPFLLRHFNQQSIKDRLKEISTEEA